MYPTEMLDLSGIYWVCLPECSVSHRDAWRSQGISPVDDGRMSSGEARQARPGRPRRRESCNRLVQGCDHRSAEFCGF